MKLNFVAVATIACALVMTGCGSDNDNSGTAGGQTPGTNQISGVIVNMSANNSMTVNSGQVAITYDTSNAEIFSDGGSGLHVGKVVTVDGEIKGNTGKAKKIRYDSDVEGTVLSINTDENNEVTSLVVMGQTVLVDDMTVYKDGLTGSADLAVGMSIEVSGILTDAGILAKYIETKHAEDMESEIKGIVTGIPVGTIDVTSFMIGNCTIYIDPDLTKFDGFENAVEIINGMEVEVKAELVDVTAEVCSVTATKIELEDKNDDYGEKFVGVVISLPENNRFILSVSGMENNITVVLSENTMFKDGTVIDIVVGVNIKVIGTYNLNGEVEASTVKFENYLEVPMKDMVKMEGYVQSIDLSTNTMTVLGQTLTINSMTMMDEDKSYADIVVGDFVKLKATYIDSMLVAKNVSIKAVNMNAMPKSRVEGVAVVDLDMITVEGVKIVVPVLDPALTVIANGDRVVITGSYDDSTMALTADSIKVK